MAITLFQIDLDSELPNFTLTMEDGSEYRWIPKDNQGIDGYKIGSVFYYPKRGKRVWLGSLDDRTDKWEANDHITLDLQDMRCIIKIIDEVIKQKQLKLG